MPKIKRGKARNTRVMGKARIVLKNQKDGGGLWWKTVLRRLNKAQSVFNRIDQVIPDVWAIFRRGEKK